MSTAEAIYAMTEAEYREWERAQDERSRRRRESPSKRAIRRAATRAGYTVTRMHWSPLRAPRQRTMDVDGDDDGWTLDGGWEVWLTDPAGNETQIESYQLDLLLEEIERMTFGGRR